MWGWLTLHDRYLEGEQIFLPLFFSGASARVPPEDAALCIFDRFRPPVPEDARWGGCAVVTFNNLQPSEVCRANNRTACCAGALGPIPGVGSAATAAALRRWQAIAAPC